MNIHPEEPMTYRRFTVSMKLCDVLHANYALLPIVHRFNIDSGIGNKTIARICRDNGVDANFFTEIINVFHDERYFPETALRGSDVRLIIEYLRKTHSYYVDHLLPRIASMIRALTASGRKNPALKMVRTLFNDYRTEFLRHIAKEERTIFPHALDVAERFPSGKHPLRRPSVAASSIRTLSSEHTRMDETLLDLKNILIKYLEQPFDVHLCDAIIFELHRLERDVADHGRIEDRILFTVIDSMEKQMRKLRK